MIVNTIASRGIKLQISKQKFEHILIYFPHERSFV